MKIGPILRTACTRTSKVLFSILLSLLLTAHLASCGGGKHSGVDGGDDGEVDGIDDGGDDAGVDGGDDGEVDGADDGGVDGDDDGGDGGLPGEFDCEGVAFLPCTPRIGDKGATLLMGTVLTPDQVICNGQVLISRTGQHILCVDEDCSQETEAAQATVVCADIITPGLIDAHNHMTYNTVPPWRHPGVLYEHRDEWRMDPAFNAYDAALEGSGADRYSEFRLLMSGTTAVHKSSYREATFTGVRNLDQDENGNQLGLPDSAVTECIFPLASSCTDADKPDYANLDPTLRSYIVHLSEGINQKSYGEFAAFVDDGQLGDKTTLIHGVSFDGAQMTLVATTGATFVWSPQTNIDLYGVTAAVTAIWNMGVPVALAPDWTISGTMNLIAELKCADHLNDKYYGSFFSARDLVSMVTSGAARVLRLDDLIGRLAPGHFADVLAIHGDREHPFDAVVQMGAADVRAVFIGGEAFYGDADALNPDIEFNAYCEDLEVCGATKRICVKQAPGDPPQPLDSDDWATWRLPDYVTYLQGQLDQRRAINQPGPADEYLYTLFPLFECEATQWCDMGNAYVPGEPTAEDADGDGLIDGEDNCASVFNPDQGDLDGDGAGDACDACPFAADPADCPEPNPGDRDMDGLPNQEDNCPDNRNPDQADTDVDGLGDACDPCPDYPNPDERPCPATIYDIKTGVYGPGDPVSLGDVLVTGVSNDSGFFVQMPADHADYDGVDWSGIYVYMGSGASAVLAGDRVDLAGSVADYHGQLEIVDVTGLNVLTQGNPPPTPEPVTLAEISAGGTRAAALEGAVCEIADVTVTQVNPSYNEWQVDDALWIGDFLYIADPLPSIGEVYSTVRGVLRWNYNDTILEPRSAADIVLGPATLTDLAPAQSFAFVGETAEPVPGLVVVLSHAALSDRVVNLWSADPSILDVPTTVSVIQGETSAAVLVTGISPGSTSIHAELDGVELSALVRVVDETEDRHVAAITPAALTMSMNDSAVLLVSLDIPAPVGGLTLDVAASPGTLIAVPATLDVLPHQLTAELPVDSGVLAAGIETITVSLGASSQEATVEVVSTPVTGLIIAQVFYDGPGADNGTEWVQLYNGTGNTIDLSGYSLGTGGSDYTTGVYQLSGTVAPFACFIAGGPTTSADNGNPAYDLVQDFNPDIQNSGSIADGVALFDVPAVDITPVTVPIDAVIYGSNNDNNLLDETGSAGAPDAPDCSEANSLLRNGPDSWICQTPPQPLTCPAF